MKKDITRRDFLKLAGLVPLSVAIPKLVSSLPQVQQIEKPQNVIIVVFDAFSAYNISLYGYLRKTTPNLARLAERAVVYHNHYAGGSFTTPGTASLLTGTLPWTHRAFSYNKPVDEFFVDKNIFSAFQNYYRFAYSHNSLVYTFFKQFSEHLENLIPMERLFLTSDGFISKIFEKDEDIATVSWIRAIKKKEDGYAYSLYLPHLYEKYRDAQIANLKSEYPRGLPGFGVDNYFLLEDAVTWLGNEIRNLPQPFMGYFHLFPPHAPYRARREFDNYFENENWVPVYKPIDVFSPEGDRSYSKLARMRKTYDEFILNVDSEFGKIIDHLSEAGLLENSWIVLTSDHGEMFERGIRGHLQPVLYQPGIRIPLMIFEPGRKERKDIYTPTSAIDVLPTLLHVTGNRPATWSEGTVLPPFNGPKSETERNHYVVEAKHNEKYAPFSTATIALIKGNYKLTYFFGYKELGPEGERIELYDVENDPEEMKNLYQIKKATAAELLHELKTKLEEVNKPYL